MYRLKRILLMPPIPQATIDRVLEATDIVELIGSFIALKKLGQSFQGLCPCRKKQSSILSIHLSVPAGKWVPDLETCFRVRPIPLV